MVERVLGVEIVAKKRDFWRVLKLLRDLGVLHLEETENETLGLSPNEKAESQRLRGFLRSLGDLSLPEAEPPEEFDIDAAEKALAEIRELQSRVNSLEAELSKLRFQRRLAEAAARLVPEGEEPLALVLPREELRQLELVRRWGAEVRAAEVEGKVVAVVLTDRVEDFKKFAYDEGFNILRLPEGGLRALSQEIERLERELQEAQKELNSRLEKFRGLLSKAKAYAKDRLALLAVKERFAEAGRFTFTLRGWVLEADAPKLAQALEPLASVEFRKPQKREYHRVPVKLKNWGIFKPFEALIELYQPPVYGTFDPTWTLWAFFPFYFGFMLGDVGYGLLALLIFLFLYRFKAVRDFAKIYIWAALWTIFFGFLYGEFFGELGTVLGMKWIWFHRLHDVQTILVAALVFGVVQVLFGIALGILNNLRLGHPKHALFELGRLVGILGLFGTIGGAVSGVKPVLVTGAVLLVLAFPLLLIEGFVGPLEMLSAVGNMMSFVRLAAIGLASAILATIANSFYLKIPVVVFALVVTLLFHSLNTVLGIFDPTIQGLRLQYVEFFSKFYVPGGKAFKPLRKGGEGYA